MSNYDEEHGIRETVNDRTATQDNESERQEVRNELRDIFRSYGGHEGEEGNDGRLLQLLSQLIPESLQEEWLEQLEQKDKKGCPESFIDSLPRVPKSKLSSNGACSICFCVFLEDDYPLVVELPHCNHRFDLECISVWLSKSTTCPLCRDDVMSHKVEIDTTQAEMQEDWGMYG